MATDEPRREAANEEFANSSFLYGGNAGYIEELYAQYQENPSALSEDWQAYFGSLKDARADVIKNADGASWKRSNWPIHANGEWVSALDGDWDAVEKVVKDKIAAKGAKDGATLSDQDIQRAAKDSVSAIMMIRAYRMRGHLHANLDPLGIAGNREAYDELKPTSYGFTEADYDRRIFIDYMLGLEFATVREMVESERTIQRYVVGCRRVL